jgi:hypothetical protein
MKPIERPYSVDRKLPSFIINRRDLEPVTGFDAMQQLEHLGIGPGLVEHEVPEIVLRERPLFVENDPGQIFIELQTSLLHTYRTQVMTLVHLRKVQTELLCRFLASAPVQPAVRKTPPIPRNSVDVAVLDMTYLFYIISAWIIPQ